MKGQEGHGRQGEKKAEEKGGRGMKGEGGEETRGKGKDFKEGYPLRMKILTTALGRQNTLRS